MFYIIRKILLALIGVSIRRGKVIVCTDCPREIEVSTCFMPNRVMLTFQDSATPPVCQGNVDCFDVKIVPGGFIIIAKVNSERTLLWEAVSR